MNCTTLSLEKLRRDSHAWAKRIALSYKPDCVVYVAKAGFVIGYEIADELNIPLIGVITVREKGNKIKDLVAPFVRKLPDFVRNFLISMELKSGIHKRSKERTISWVDSECRSDKQEYKRLLVVDDSVDTGYSLLAVYDLLKKAFPNAEIKTAGLNVWDKSKAVFETDYCLYRNTLIKAPMSKDSQEYGEFMKVYEDYRCKNLRSGGGVPQ